MKNLKKIMAFLLSACFISETGCEEMKIKQQDITVEVITLSKNVEFWETVNNGAKDAGEELGIKIICEAPDEETDTDGQIQLINDAVKNNVDAIVIAPINAEKLIEPLNNAHEAGIEIITIYSPVDSDDVSSLISTNNIDAGEIAARNLAELIGGSGEVAIISVSDNGIASREERKNGFKSVLSNNYKNIKVYEQHSSIYMEGAKDAALKCLDKHPKIKGIYTTNQSVTEGVCKAIKTLEETGEIQKDQIRVVGWNASSLEVEYIEQGILDGTLTQSPYLYGYLGVRNAYKAYNGEIIDSYINTGINYVNSENLNDDNIQILIHPEV